MQEIELTKYPYLGYSQNLIESFLILGIEKENIEAVISKESSDPISFPPTVINKLNSPTNLTMLDDKVVISLLFPSDPVISTNATAETESSTIIFFLNADTLQNKSKIPFHGCGFIFYEPYVCNDAKYYIPKCFAIISQYPYFTLFSNICKDILINFKLKNEIPLEIMIYNIVNFIPSPINFSINLSTFPSKELFTYASKFNQISRISTLSYNYQVFQLSGYPVLDINISEIFNILPTNLLIEVLIFNFLEYDMLFFSKNLEVLNLTMYIVQVLNYPCTDSIYLWHILSVSEEDLFNTDCKFVGKPWSTMLGINCTYDERIKTGKVLDAHFIVDIDNKAVIYRYENTLDDDGLKTELLHKYVKKIINGGGGTPSTFLGKDIRHLIKELDIISKQVVYTRTSIYSILSTSSYGTLKFFESNDKIKILNKNIQEVFYTFILKLLTLFYNNYHLNSCFNINSDLHNLKFFINYNEDLSRFTKEEIIFYERVKSSAKYNNYILNYIQEHKCIDLYRIPLIFSEEFIYLSKFNDERINWRYFDTIDYFYESKKPVAVSFTHFFTHYDSFMKEEIYKQIEGSKTIKKNEVVVFDRPSLAYEYDHCKLDENVIKLYQDYLMNLEQGRAEEIFPVIGIHTNNVIKDVKFFELIDVIERALISHKVIKTDSLILFSLLNIFLVTRYKCSFNESISHLRDILETIEPRGMFIRKYVYLMLYIYNIAKPIVEDDRMVNYSKMMCSFIIINFLRHKNILPNEELMNIFRIFCAQDRIEDEEAILNQTGEDEFNITYLEDFHLFLQYHVCRCGAKKPDYFLKQTENSSYDGDVFLDCFFCGTKEFRTSIVFKFELYDERFNSEIFSPLKLFNSSVRLFNLYKENPDYDKLDRDMLRKVIINLIFYCKHNNLNYKFLLKFLYNLQ
jgi:hypothetical protein